MHAAPAKFSGASPKVSVTVVTYNHGNWLAQCLESIVTQETDFPFEVIVGDDASTDGRTVKVLREYASKYPKVIVPIFREKNVGPVSNLFDVMRHARGEYIAHIDGDDIMYPRKLQNQADFLNAHHNVVIASHRMHPIIDDKLCEANTTDNYPEIGTVYDLLRYGCYFCHSSKMYRRTALMTTDTDWPIVDYYLHLEHALKGQIYYTKEVMGGHRSHAQGISKDNKFRRFIRDAYERAYDRALDLGLNKSAVERGRIRHRHAIALSHLENRDLVSFRLDANIDKPLLRYASCKQLVLHYLSSFPLIAVGLLRIRAMVKRK